MVYVRYIFSVINNWDVLYMYNINTHLCTRVWGVYTHIYMRRSDVNMCINWFRSQNSKISTKNLRIFFFSFFVFLLETCDLCSVSY